MKRAMVAATLAASGLLSFAMPAAATVHEIAGMWCAGDHMIAFPPGLSGGSNANNFAKPLFATGFIESVDPNFAGDGINGPGTLITFDFDNPASKIAPHPTLDTFFIGDHTYISAFILDPSAGFANCIVLRGG